MKQYLPKTLAGLINMYLALTLILMMGVLSLAGYYVISRTLESSLQERAKTMALQIATVTQDAVILQEYGVIDRVINDLVQQTPDVKSIRVTNLEGQDLVSVTQSRYRDRLSGGLSYQTDLMFFDRPLGNIELVLSRESIQRTLFELLLIGSAVLFLVLVGFFGVIRRLLLVKLVLPVQRLTDQMGTTSIFLTKDVALEPNLPRELTVLNTAIYDLQRALNSQIKSLEEAHEFRQKATTNLCQNQRMSTIGQLAAGLAHNLNTPLANIIGYAQMGRVQTDDDAVKKRLQTIEKQAKLCTQSVRNLLSVSKPPKLVLSEVDVLHLINGIAEMMRPVLLKEIGLTVRIDAPNEPVRVLADNSALEQIIYNLITNSAEAGATEITFGFSLVETPEKSVWQVGVADNGEGVADDQREAIFKPFFTTKTHQKHYSENSGTGLGLYLTRSLLVNMNGGIQLGESSSGTVFTVELVKV